MEESDGILLIKWVATYGRSCIGETTSPKDAFVRKRWTVKGARALFEIKVSVDGDMLEYLMEVKTPKEAWEIYARMFATKPKPIEDKVCYQCGKPGHNAGDYKVTMVVVDEGSATEKLR